MGNYRRRWTGQSWTIFEEGDGQLGWFVPAPKGGWEWETDLRGLRMEHQLKGTAPTLDAAQANFKAAYERWRAKFTDEEFDRTYRRSGPPGTHKRT